MILSRTPLRISFVGGGTDLPAFYRREPGCVLSTAIDKYIYIAVNRKFDGKVRASYSVTEIVEEARELRHELIRHALELVGLRRGVEVVSISDVPSEGTGLGSSSAYTVGLLKALHAFQGRWVSAERLAREACQVEIDLCAKPIGKQDQYIAAFGGLQCICFNPDETVTVDPVICRPETRRRLERSLLLLHTGLARSSDAILREQTANIEGDETTRRLLRELVGLAGQFRAALAVNNVEPLGEILHCAWERKKRMARSISNCLIDEWYERARRHGAIGGKLVGAGAGGFLLLFAPSERHEEILRNLPELRPVPLRLEPQGSMIVHAEEYE
jgi:D-glycero-alpha-D-manno-heptose-7-phosphate kinase